MASYRSDVPAGAIPPGRGGMGLGGRASAGQGGLRASTACQPGRGALGGGESTTSS